MPALWNKSGGPGVWRGMKAVGGAVVAVVVGLIAAVTPMGPTERAQACSCPDCDAFQDSPLAIRATATSWNYVRDKRGEPVERPTEHPGAPDGARERPVVISVSVTEVFEGQVPQTITISSTHLRPIPASGRLATFRILGMAR